jgi:hypothetical protein
VARKWSHHNENQRHKCIQPLPLFGRVRLGCVDMKFTIVRFHWQGDYVEMLGTPPIDRTVGYRLNQL